MRAGIVILTAVLALAACSDDSGPEIPSMSGTWSGSISGGDVTMTLAETDQSVSGSGNIDAGEESIAISVSGSHVHPDVSLTFSASGFEDFNLSGKFVEDDRITGELNGSGFDDDAITLRRQ